MNQPKLNFQEALVEICNRTGMPVNTVYQILWTYIDIVKECLNNQVAIVFGDLGVFRYQHHEARYNVSYYNPKTREHCVAKCFPAYDSPTFRCARQWQAQMKQDSTEYYKQLQEEE